MQTFTLLLLLGYVLLGVLLLSLNLRARWHWSVKVFAIALTSAFYFVTWWGLRESEGWPTRADPLAEFELLAFDVRQPDKRDDSPGAIFLWVRSPHAVEGTPRAHRLAYSEALHQAVLEAGERLGRGRRQHGERRPGASDRSDARGPALLFRDMILPTLPEKRGE
jgi:hypothetical protein